MDYEWKTSLMKTLGWVEVCHNQLLLWEKVDAVMDGMLGYSESACLSFPYGGNLCLYEIGIYHFWVRYIRVELEGNINM